MKYRQTRTLIAIRAKPPPTAPPMIAAFLDLLPLREKKKDNGELSKWCGH